MESRKSVRREIQGKSYSVRMSTYENGWKHPRYQSSGRGPGLFRKFSLRETKLKGFSENGMGW